MLIKLYDCTDSYNTINKTLTGEIERDIRLKDKVNIITPIITLKSSSIINKNYCFIPSFNRYYFIQDVIIVNDNIQEIYLKCDVLESFKDDILNSEGVVSMSDADNYLSNGATSEERKIIDIYEGEPINYKDNIILIGLR